MHIIKQIVINIIYNEINYYINFLTKNFFTKNRNDNSSRRLVRKRSETKEEKMKII